MSKRTSRALFFCLLLSGIKILPLAAGPQEDLVPACKVLFQEKIKELNVQIADSENYFIRYRWAEAKIRRLFYDRLWSARQLALDPLDKAKREQGKKEEEILIEELKPMEKESEDAANGFLASIHKLQDAHLLFLNCCAERMFGECIKTAFQKPFQILEELRLAFEHIFEHEREYRKAVALTAGGREGLYPDDAVEKPEVHTEYFWRFENEHAADRFGEDGKVMDALHDLRSMLNWNFEGVQCCYPCGKTDLERRVESA